MIILAIAICTNIALTDCTVTRRIEMPTSATMVSCNQVAAVMLDMKTGPLILPPGFNRVTCEFKP